LSRRCGHGPAMATAAGPGPSSSPWDGRQQVLADHQLQTVQKEKQQNE